jgi:histidinol-phosphate aminotransferase
VPLREDFALDADAMLDAITRTSRRWYSSPINNPTGNLFDREAIRTILSCAPGLVVVDEAYAPFADDSFLRPRVL